MTLRGACRSKYPGNPRPDSMIGDRARSATAKAAPRDP